MSGVIHFHTKAIFILCIPLLITLLTLVYHETLFDAPSGQRRILQAELHERIKVLDKATLEHLPIFDKIPERIVIFSNEYSGFEYLEEILLTIPGVFIHKPLECETGVDACDDRDWSIVSQEFREIVGNETLSRKIYPLLHCKSASRRGVYGSSSVMSTEVQEYCNENPQICLGEYFQRRLCEMSSLQVLVVKNFDFNLALSIINLKHSHIVYMIRDPRGVAIEQTEVRKGSCSNFTHCFDVSELCKTMRSDEGTVEMLVKGRYRHFKLLRLEDLAYNLMQEMTLMFEDWGIAFTKDSYNVMSELKPKIDNTTLDWDKDKEFVDIEEMQEKCRNVLEFYAFKVIEDQKEFDMHTRTVNDLTSRLKAIEVDGI